MTRREWIKRKLDILDVPYIFTLFVAIASILMLFFLIGVVAFYIMKGII